jgi:hypothetical protein
MHFYSYNPQTLETTAFIKFTKIKITFYVYNTVIPDISNYQAGKIKESNQEKNLKIIMERGGERFLICIKKTSLCQLYKIIMLFNFTFSGNNMSFANYICNILQRSCKSFFLFEKLYNIIRQKIARAEKSIKKAGIIRQGRGDII